jgi:acid phosphatase type 7
MTPSVRLILVFPFACRTFGPQDDDSTPSTPAECGTGITAGSDARLLRWPYVQDVTSTSATLAFGAVSGMPDGHVSIGRDTTYQTATVETASDQVPYLDEGDDPPTLRLHHAAFTGLAPATEYCYRIEASGTVLASGLMFRTAPDDPDATVHFLAVGDFGAGNTAEENVRDAITEYRDRADFLVTLGDNAYSSGTYGQWQSRVFEPYQHLLTRLPIFAVPGNHDYYTADAQPFLDNLFLPENADVAGDRERYYSMDWGPIHFVGLDSEDPLRRITDDIDGDDERDWLQGDLARADRPWTVAAYHKPMRTNNVGRIADPYVVAHLIPTIEEFEVPLVLQAHDHNYERFVPMHDDQPLDSKLGGTTYIIAGGGGAGLYDVEVGTDELQAVGLKTYNFLYGTVDACALTLEAIDEKGFVFDTVTLERC